MLTEMGINVIESEEAEEGDEAPMPRHRRRRLEALATTPKSGEQYDRTDDPVPHVCLREMGSVRVCSSREGEIAIAKRIEAGRELMIGALVQSPTDLRSALTAVWPLTSELNEGKVLLRITTSSIWKPCMAPVPMAQPANVPPPVRSRWQAAGESGARRILEDAAAGIQEARNSSRPAPPPPPVAAQTGSAES